METNYFYGIDKSIDISILEYGVLVSKEPDRNNEYLIVYGVDNDGNKYQSFASIFMSEQEINSKIEEPWFSKNSFFSHNDINEEEWLQLDVASKMTDMLSYYGSENICGVSYHTFDEEKLRELLDEYGNM